MTEDDRKQPPEGTSPTGQNAPFEATQEDTQLDTTPTPQLVPEETPKFENMVKGALFALLKPFGLFRTNESDLYLNDVRGRNDFPYLAGTIYTILATAFVTVMILYFTTDDLDNSRLQHLSPKSLSSDFSSFVFWVRDFPLVILLASYSYVFFGATKKYLKAFEPTLVEECDDFLKWPKFLVHTPQFLAITIFVFGYTTIQPFTFTTISTAACMVAAALFGLAALFPRMLERDLRNMIVELHNSLDERYFPMRRARLKHIHDARIFGFLYRGWATLNVLLAVFVLCYSYWPSLLEEIFATPAVHWPTAYVSYAIMLCAVVFSTAGAVRSYSRELDIRYFNAVKIINFEFLQRDNPNQRGLDVEQRLSGVKLFAIENDPTVPDGREAEPFGEQPVQNEFSSNMLLPLMDSTRFASTSAFSAIIFLATGSGYFSLATLIAMLFSFLLNDVTDFRTGKDKICHPNRPLPSGRLSETVAWFALAALATAFLLVTYHAPMSLNAPLLLFFGGIAYSSGFKRMLPVLATPFWCALLAVIVSEAFELSLLAATGIWLAILAREVVLDLRDAQADFNFNGKKNIAALASPFEWWFVALLVLSAAIFCVMGDNSRLAILVLLSGASLAVFGFWRASKVGIRRSSREFSLASHAMWPFVLLNG